ncbi:MAG TPA: hypothetical protein VFP92_10895 [Rhodanobacteraceae bacterium]|nr:hypothetical protein [Rhodanobacteraceae bacterium]
MKTLLVAIACAAAFVCTAASAQSYKQQRDQVFCNIMGQDVALALGDYASGVPMETSIKRADDFVCYTSEVGAECDARKDMLRNMIRKTYARLGPSYGLQNADVARIAKAQDEAKIRITSMCVQIADSR